MRKLLNNPFVSGGLALVAVAIVAKSLMGDSSPRPRQPIATIDSPDDSLIENVASSDELLAATTFLNPDSIRDLANCKIARNPFERQADRTDDTSLPIDDSRPMASATIRVKGVWIQNNIRYVVIDDKTLQAGQSLDRVRVERIDDQGVWVAANNETHFIQPGQSWTYQYPLSQDESRN